MIDFQKFTDGQLLELLKEGRHGAFKAIHERYYGVLYRHAMKRLDNREEVRDILQELFSYLWANRETLVFSSGLAAYLYTSVRNRVINVFAKQQVRTAYADSLQGFMDVGEYATDEQVRERELLELVEKEVALLPPQMKRVFELSRFEQLSHNEIAELLGTSPLTVRKQIQNALKILRIKLGTNVFYIFF